MVRAIIYSKDNCMQCKMTKKWLADNGMNYIEKNVDEEAEWLEEVKDMGFKSLPVTLVPNTPPILGFAPSKLKEALL